MKRLHFPMAAILAAGFAAQAGAQTTFASLTGTVTDPNGSVVPKAAVEATHLGSNYRYVTETNGLGLYSLGQLREGEYQVRVRAAGFREFVAQKLVLAARDARRLDVPLQIGAVETAIEVSAGGPALIETETARISDTRTFQEMRKLPLNTQSANSLVQMTAGVYAFTGATGSFTVRFAGSRTNQENQAVDGISYNNLYDGTQIGPLGDFIESFQEMRVDMANNTAEFGSLGQLTLISKSGGNRVHGSMADYYTTSGLTARNPFALSKAAAVRHYPSATIGGPVRLPGYDGRNRTFYFGSFETQRGGVVDQLLNPTLAPVPWRSGDFSSLAPGTIVRDPSANNQPFPGNRIPAARLNPVSLKIQERFWPLPNFGDPNVLASQNYRENRQRSADPNTMWTVRGDHRLSDRSTVYARYTWHQQFLGGWDGNLPTIGLRYRQRDTRSLIASWSHTIRPTLLNELRGGFTYNDLPCNTALRGKQVVQDLGLVGLVDNLPDLPGVFKVSFAGIGLTGISLFCEATRPGFQNRVYQLQDHLNWFRGRHTLKLGVLLSPVRFAQTQANTSLFGNVSFSNRFANHPYADFLLGIPTSASRAFAPLADLRWRRAWDFFATDDVKVNSKLTLNAGLRYEYHPGWYSPSGLMSVFDVSSGKIVVPDGALSKVSPLMPRGYVDVVEAQAAGRPGRSLFEPDRNNFAPRIGLAWRPWDNRTVFRAGYGIYFDVTPPRLTSAGAPFLILEPTFTNPANAPTVIFPRVFPQSGTGRPDTVTLPSAVRNDIRTPYSMQYSATIEHERWGNGFRISYVGTNTRQGEWTYNINQPVADARPFISKPRLFGMYPAISYLTNGSGHQYHSVTGELKRRLQNGLGYNVSYVLARDIADLERGQSPEDAYDRKRERAVWIDIPTHRLTSSFSYQIPVGRGKRFLQSASKLAGAFLGGWELQGIVLAQTGQFLTPLWTGPDTTGTAYTASSTPAQVTIRPNHLRDANLPGDQRSTARWFDPAAFAAPSPGAFGTSAKGVIKGPGLTVFHSGLAKIFTLTERVRLLAQVTGTNMFNHPNWSNPALNITAAAQVGVISGVGVGNSGWDRTGPRAFQLGARLEW